jgi:UrcA family protein
MNSICFAGGFALALAMPAFAVAAPAVAPYGDLDFSRPADAAVFNARLEAAAKRACKGEAKVQLDEQRRFVRCETLVKNQAVSRLPAAQRAALAAASAAAIDLAGR